MPPRCGSYMRKEQVRSMQVAQDYILERQFKQVMPPEQGNKRHVPNANIAIRRLTSQNLLCNVLITRRILKKNGHPDKQNNNSDKTSKSNNNQTYHINLLDVLLTFTSRLNLDIIIDTDIYMYPFVGFDYHSSHNVHISNNRKSLKIICS